MSQRIRTIGLSAFFAIAFLNNGRALHSQETGFPERYALAENREAVLSELIPGTESYFYFHCLHCQTVGKLAEARGHLDAWIANFGNNSQNQRMQTRQFLLEYNSNAPATLQHLRNEFGINTEHPEPRRDEAAALETKLDQNLILWSTNIKNHSGSLENIETIALGHTVPYLTEAVNLRRWIERMDRCDFSGLVELLAREIKMNDSRGFGWAAIHHQLSVSQLLELQERIPSLLESNTFVQARLRRIRPNDDQSVEDADILRAHLIALESFVKTLPESQNSLKATVLYHRLQLDERSGIMDRDRFIQYISLPSNRPFTNSNYVAKKVQESQVNLAANYQSDTLLAPIGNDTLLVRRYLEHFFQTDPNIAAFSTYIDRDFLQRVFASTKILYGIGDSKSYYAQLSPDEQRELQSRVEMNFSLTNPTYYRPTDTVRLTLDLKNVPELLVKIYSVNARNVLLQQKQPIGTAIDLDGLVANLERRIAYSQPSERRHREVLEMPELQGGGVWIVDILTAGLRSRTLIHKGHLHAMQTQSNAGEVLKVFDGDGKHIPTAKAIFGTREFTAEKDGSIVIPFGRETKVDSLVLIDGPIASVQQFVHRGEAYSLQAGFLVDPQSLLAGAQASIVVRPNLMCNGMLVSLSQLDKPKLTVTSTDLDGIASTQVFNDLKLVDSGELIKRFLVPQRLASIVFNLSGEVLMLSSDTRVPVSASHAVAINESARTAKTRDFYLTQSDKGYALEVLGRNGEPIGRLPVQLEFKLFGVVPTTSVRLATNALGQLDLGPLENVERFKVTADAIGVREFNLTPPAPNWPATYHALRDKPIRVAMSLVPGVEPAAYSSIGNDKQPGRYSLLETRGGIVAEYHSKKIAIKDGLLQIAGLEPGTYRLIDHVTGRTMQIAVVNGEVVGDHYIGQQKIIETNRVRPVHVRDVQIQPDKIQIEIGNSDPFTRVHVIANAFRPITSYGLALPAPEMPLTSATRMRYPSFYMNSLKLDEEYQYVLQRQFGKKYLGSLLPQPSAILNPWELAVTQNSKKDAQSGDKLAEMAADVPAPSDASPVNRPTGGDAANMSPDYEFLKRGSLLLTNGQCDEAGKLSVDRKLLDGMSSVTVLVVHPTGTTFRVIAMPSELTRTYTDRRLAKSFDANEKLTEVQSVKILRGADKIDLGDAASTRVKLYSSISEVYQLYKTFLPNNPNFTKFECLTRWNILDDAQKEVYYSDLACHELHLFLLLHDKPFFDRVVRPYLSNKMQKQFMDDYVLDADLASYTRPWKLAQLNAVERVLLAKKLGSQSSRTKRWMTDVVGLNVVDASMHSRFATALMSNRFGDVDELGRLNSNGVYFGKELFGAKLERWMDRSAELEGKSGSAGGLGGGFGAKRKDESDQYFDSNSNVELGLTKDYGNGAMAFDDNANDGRKELEKLRAGARRAGRELSLAREQLYQSLESTRKWAESNYFRLLLGAQTSELIRPTKFWLDYLNQEGDSGFLSKHLDMAASNHHEALLALAVLGLPIQSEPVDILVEEGRVVAAKANNSIAFVQGIERIESVTEPTTLLASQSIFTADDPVESAKPLQESSLIKGTVYRMRLVLTNPSASLIRVQILQQIPQGAIALESAKVVAGKTLDLASFATQELNTKFYFPESGDFTLYGAQIAIDNKLAIAAPSRALKVLDKPISLDESSWAYLSLWGTDEQVLEYLKHANLAKTDLNAIAWRMSNRKFYDECLTKLSEYGIFQPVLWAYSVKHNDTTRLQEYLEKSDPIVGRVGPVFHANIMQVEPVDRLTFEHLDFRPLVVARTHLLGSKRVILNDGLASQYERMLSDISNQKSIQPEQRLALVYYLILQNRIEEAIQHFAQIDAAGLESKLQYDYFVAYFDMLQGKFEEADLLAQKYAAYPNPRWRDWFAQVRSHIADRKAIQSGNLLEVSTREDWKTEGSNRILTGGREQQNGSASETMPALDLLQDGDKVVIRHRNLEDIEINFYLMDAELLFSRNPFAQQDGGRLNTIAPNLSEKRKLTDGRATIDSILEIPEKLKNKNLMIEVIGKGLTRNLVIYSNSLVVNLSPNQGRLQILSKDTMQPLEGTYVKVFSKNAGGAAKFYKDGYTDLRGQFDYASLSTNDLDSATRFAILVLHPERGTMVKEVEPPKR